MKVVATLVELFLLVTMLVSSCIYIEIIFCCVDIGVIVWGFKQKSDTRGWVLDGVCV